MSEETIEEISNLDLIVRALASTKAPIAAFVIMFIGTLYLATIGFIKTPEEFIAMLSANGITSGLLKVLKE